MISRKPDDVIIYDVVKNFQEPKMYLCTKFVCSVPDCGGGVGGQRNKLAERQIFVNY